MHLPIGPGHRGDMQDLLRSVGALLDLVSAHGVVIGEDSERLAVSAQVSASPVDRVNGRWSPLDRVLSGRQITRLRAQAVARRGTGHAAGPHERALRMIGRRIDELGLQHVTIIERESEARWLVWHGTRAHGRTSLILLEDGELHAADAAARETRQARAASEVATGVGSVSVDLGRSIALG